MRTASPIPGLGSTTQEGALDEPDRYLVSASPTRSARGRLTCDGYRTGEPPHPAELPSGAVSCLVAGSGSRNTTCLGDFALAAYAGPEAGARGAWRSSSQPFDRAVSPRPPGPHLGEAARLRRTSPFAQLRAGSPNSRRLCLRQAYPRRAREPAPPGVSPSRSSGAGWAGSTSVTSTRSCRTADAEPPARVTRIAARARAPTDPWGFPDSGQPRTHDRQKSGPELVAVRTTGIKPLATGTRRAYCRRPDPHQRSGLPRPRVDPPTEGSGDREPPHPESLPRWGGPGLESGRDQGVAPSLKCRQPPQR